MADTTTKPDAAAAKPSADPRAPENQAAPAAPAAPATDAPSAPADDKASESKPAETEKPASKPSEKEAAPEQKTITLNYEFKNVMPEGVVSFGPGEVTVDAVIAEDLLRRNQEQIDYRESVHVKDEALMNAGTISGGGQ